MEEKRINLAVFISGRGSNLQALINAVENGSLNVRIRVVVSDNAEAKGLERARRSNIESIVVVPSRFANKEAYESELIEIINDRDIGLICLAGFMRVLSPLFVRTFEGKIMNIHPSLLPAFPGLNVQQKALEYGVKFSGCTVHFVNEDVDAGPIIIQAVVPVLENDSSESLSERILEQEHIIYPEAVRLFAEGKLKIQGRKVFCYNDDK